MSVLLLLAVMVTTRQVYDVQGRLQPSFVRERLYVDQGQPTERVVYSAQDVLEYREIPSYQVGKLVHIRRLGDVPRSDSTYPGVGYLLWRDIYPAMIEDRGIDGGLVSVRIPGVLSVDVRSHTVMYETVNAAGRLTSERLPNGDLRRYSYNSHGDVSSMTLDRVGVRVEKHQWYYTYSTSTAGWVTCKCVSYYYPGPRIWPRWIDTKKETAK